MLDSEAWEECAAGARAVQQLSCDLLGLRGTLPIQEPSSIQAGDFFVEPVRAGCLRLAAF